MGSSLQPHLDVLLHSLGAVLELVNELVAAVLVFQPQLNMDLFQELVFSHIITWLDNGHGSNLDLLNVFVVKIVLLQSLQFIICIIFQSFHDLDLKLSEMQTQCWKKKR